MTNKPATHDIDACIHFYLHILSIKDYSRHTICLKKSHLSQFHHWLLEEDIVDISLVTLEVFERYMGYLRTKRSQNHHDQFLCASTIRTRLTTVRVFLQFLTQRGLIAHREVDKYELPSVGLLLPRPILSYDDVLRVIKQIPLNTIKGIRDRAIVECFYASGIRRGEMVNLDLMDVDFSQRQLRILKGKGKKDRYVPFGKAANKWLLKYLRDARSQLANLSSGNALFVNNAGTRYKPGQLSGLMAKYIKKANINKTGACHQYRHAAATHMLDNEADIRHVQEFLGHSSISTTQLYLHVSKAKLRNIYTKTHPRAD